jgi:cytochrome c-type biogenesis protein CcmH
VPGLLFAAAVVTNPVSSQTPQPVETVGDDQVNAVARELYCPVCENTPLDVCPTRACADWRELIRQKLAEGWDSAQIKQYFAEQYGDRVLPVPPLRGLNWLVYLLPPVAILGGAFVLMVTLRRMRRTSPGHETGTEIPTTQPSLNEKYLAQIEAELKQKE